MQTEKTVEVNCRLGIADGGFRNRNRWSQIVVRAFAKWHDHVQTVNRATLKNSNERFTPATGDSLTRLSQDGALQKGRRRIHRAKTCQRHATRFDKESSVHVRKTSS